MDLPFFLIDPDTGWSLQGSRSGAFPQAWGWYSHPCSASLQGCCSSKGDQVGHGGWSGRSLGLYRYVRTQEMFCLQEVPCLLSLDRRHLAKRNSTWEKVWKLNSEDALCESSFKRETHFFKNLCVCVNERACVNAASILQLSVCMWRSEDNLGFWSHLPLCLRLSLVHC